MDLIPSGNSKETDTGGIWMSEGRACGVHVCDWRGRRWSDCDWAGGSSGRWSEEEEEEEEEWGSHSLKETRAQRRTATLMATDNEEREAGGSDGEEAARGFQRLTTGKRVTERITSWGKINVKIYCGKVVQRKFHWWLKRCVYTSARQQNNSWFDSSYDSMTALRLYFYNLDCDMSAAPFNGVKHSSRNSRQILLFSVYICFHATFATWLDIDTSVHL